MQMRYYPRYQKHKRFISIQSHARGKKHYWGEPGKNYGFYTSQDQSEIKQYSLRKDYTGIKLLNTYQDKCYTEGQQQSIARQNNINRTKVAKHRTIESQPDEYIPQDKNLDKKKPEKLFQISKNIDIALPNLRKINNKTITKQDDIKNNPQRQSYLPFLRQYHHKWRYSPTYSSSLDNPLITVAIISDRYYQ